MPDEASMLTGKERVPMIVDELHWIKESLLSLLFPRLCHFCDSLAALRSTSLCEPCQEALKPIGPGICSQCGLPFAGLAKDRGMLCGRCLTHPPPYSRARYGFMYMDGLKEGIVRFKYGGRLYLGTTLGKLLVDAFSRSFSELDHDVIVPVPIHRKRLVARGFNQVIVMGEHLSRATGIPMDRSCFEKIRDTPPQVGLTRQERLKNLHKSFEVIRQSAIAGKRVLLIDDVATTGSTIAEAAKTLLAAGAARADALVLALRSASVDRPSTNLNQ
jgi:ComF family protein